MDTMLAPTSAARTKNRLREFRRRADITQMELAARIGVRQAAISLAEKTGKGLGDDKWELLAAELGTDVLTLRGWAKIYANS